MENMEGIPKSGRIKKMGCGMPFLMTRKTLKAVRKFDERVDKISLDAQKGRSLKVKRKKR